ncbi:RNA polymerase sigma factor RpoD [Primorskyibacter flagellatus]|uniref:RNA polymerase sigma factor RpoD n=1 Tax=Primorskyibacter flagellatus TaxID=1387277 RepID=A0A917AGF9_9RHOB|nr:sigma-70 family RNA polymerase sigma factor [Primorskyibacter flagellatus]GGE50620.1 RNA polymerase sigma factor RpoD [Primorskyibacter flagellatus]
MMPNTMRAAAQVPLLAADEERDAILRWQDHGDRVALELLLRSHARQAWSMAARRTDNPAHLEDLAAEGIIGLIRAADSFDRTQDVRFGTYAAWWVMNGISAASARIRTVIDVPPRVAGAQRRGEEDHIVRMALQGVVPLDARVGEGTVMDVLVSADLTPEESAAAESQHAAQCHLIDRAMADLDADEAEVIRRRRLQAVPETLEDLAEAMNMTRDRLRQVERRAMQRLRRVLLENGFHRAMLG